METKLAEKETQEKELHVQVEWSAIEADYNDFLSEYAKLPIPGFRPGKAPRSSVAKTYEKKILEDVSYRCANRLSKKAMEKEDVASSGPVAITDILIEPGKPFSFKAEFTALPKFNLPDLSKLQLKTTTDAEKRDEISLWLLENTELTIPGQLIQQELAFDGNANAVAGGDDWQGAANRVKLLLIIIEVAKQNGIEVDDKDVNARVEWVAKENATDPIKLKKNLLSSGGLSRISRFLAAEKVLDFIIEGSQ